MTNEWKERDCVTHGCRRFKILVNARADGNPERNENASKANHAKGDVTCVQANFPQGCYKSVDGKELAKRTLVGLSPRDIITKVRRTRVISATPTSLICWMMPCAVQ
jgi:hypothetical protein